MLTATDIMAGKMAVQLGLADAGTVRAELRELDRDPSAARDLINRLTDMGRLDEPAIQRVRHRVALYEHVRSEAAYLRFLERRAAAPKEVVAHLISQLEASAFRRRLGDVLVRRGKLTLDQDRAFQRKVREFLHTDDERVLARYRREDFAGVGRPLIPGSRLEPQDFKISTLFRSRETQALVERAQLQALREEAREAAGGRPAPKAASSRTRSTGRPHVDMPAQDLDAATPRASRELEEDEHPTFREAPRDEEPRGGLSMDEVRKLRRIADYDLVEVLGTGGMGAVFLGQKEGAGEYVAIKVLLNQAAGELELGRFRREIELTRRIRHPSVIHIIDAGETPEGLSFLVVPALAGKELRSYLERAEGQGLAPALVVRVFEQVLEGMQAVHELGIVHRDLKPENVFVLAGGSHEVKIMDFGLAKLGDEAPPDVACFRTMQTDAVAGSPAYMSPEAITNDPMDGRTDVYSLGILLFEMLTGRLPLESETAEGFLGQHLICPPLTLAEARPERRWDPALEELLAQMMAKTRDERPASCLEVRRRFQALTRAVLASAEEAPAAEPVGEETSAWGFKGLLGRLWGRDG